MIPINRTYAPIQAFVDELARCGVEHAVTCPGSRNAPLVLSLHADERIRTWAVVDERSAGFAALGIAKASGRPCVLTCTSGTAAANLLPAVVEAREARVPLIVLTADRPPELREVGAGQSIDQLKLYGGAVKWFVEVGTHEPSRETAIHHRALACRAHATAREGRPGPVHLNFPLREPLAPVPEALDERDWEGRAGGRPWTQLPDSATYAEEALEELAGELAAAREGAIVCGPAGEDVAEAAAWVAEATGWPLLAEPTSGVRCGPHDRSQVVAHYDALLRAERFAAAHRPAVVLRVGDTPTSKPLRAWLATAARQVVVDPHAVWHEPTRRAGTIVRAPAGPFLRELAMALSGSAAPSPGWLASWLDADAAVPAALAAMPDPFEPKALAAVAEAFPGGATLWVSSSMPIRDVETFFPSVAAPLRFLANRGANGIDGVVSSALGAAAVSPSPAVLLTGELALLHDVGALVTARRHGIALTVVCLNNGGGGIFDFLPVAEHAEAAAYEAGIATPVPFEPERAAALAGMAHTRARTPEEVRAAVTRGGIVEVRTDRAANVALHRELFAQVAAAIGG